MRHCVRGKKKKELEISKEEGVGGVYIVRRIEFLFQFCVLVSGMRTVTGLAKSDMHMLLQEWLQIRG